MRQVNPYPEYYLANEACVWLEGFLQQPAIEAAADDYPNPSSPN